MKELINEQKIKKMRFLNIQNVKSNYCVTLWNVRKFSYNKYVYKNGK